MEEGRKTRYREKLARLKEYHGLLEKWLHEDDLDTLIQENNYRNIFSTYHSGQLAIEVLTDIAAMIVKDLGLVVRDDYKNFDVLKEQRIINFEIYKSIKELNGLRNRLVHDYNGLVDKIAWNTLTRLSDSFLSFHSVVEKWLTKQ
jgi:uncharacterized protein YutE (UPF0331/DUF86 family)